MAEKKSVPEKKKKSSFGKILSWIIVIAVFYVLTSANVSVGPVEESKKVIEKYTVQEPIVVEKIVKTTKYREERVPYGTPRCEQVNYNFTYTYKISESFSNQRMIKCSFDVTNQEDIAGNFSFYVQYFKSRGVTEGSDQKKTIPAFGTKTFEWETDAALGETVSCLLQSNNPPKRIRCFYLEPITYQTKRVPYVVEELKNVTEYRSEEKSRTTMIKENVTKEIYTNKFFGYNQFFYFGY